MFVNVSFLMLAIFSCHILIIISYHACCCQYPFFYSWFTELNSLGERFDVNECFQWIEHVNATIKEVCISI